jgi:hypothetical protein
LKFFQQTLPEKFQSNLDFKISIAIMIAIEKQFRIDQDPIFKFKPDCKNELSFFKRVLLNLVHPVQFCSNNKIVPCQAACGIGIERDFDEPGLFHADIREVSFLGCKGGNLIEERDAGSGIPFLEGFCDMSVIEQPAGHLPEEIHRLLPGEWRGAGFICGALLLCEFHGYFLGSASQKTFLQKRGGNPRGGIPAMRQRSPRQPGGCAASA